MTPELSRPVRLDTLSREPRALTVEADEAERQGLARRFGLVAIEQLTAEVSIRREGEMVAAEGRVTAQVTQSCVASGVPIEVRIHEPFDLHFRPAPTDGQPEEEIELGESELDVSFYEGAAVDIGEAVAETLALALDPYPRAPGAEATLKAAGVKSEAEVGPFGALAGLRDKLAKPS